MSVSTNWLQVHTGSDFAAAGGYGQAAVSYVLFHLVFYFLHRVNFFGDFGTVMTRCVGLNFITNAVHMSTHQCLLA